MPDLFPPACADCIAANSDYHARRDARRTGTWAAA
jgi:hypothetical protein